MFHYTRTKRSAIGVDIGLRSIKAVQLEQRGKAYRVIAGLTLPRDPATALTAALLDQLVEAMDRLQFRGSEIVLACPPAQLHSAIFELPPAAGGAPLEKLAETELRRACQLDDQDIEMTWWDLPGSNRTNAATSVMAVGAARSATETIAELFEKSGLNVVAIDTIPCALARATAPVAGDAMTIACDLGAECATVLLARNGQVIYQRMISEIGTDVLVRRVVDELRLGEPEARCVIEQLGITDAGANHAASLSPRRSRLREIVQNHIDSVGQEVEISLGYAAHKYAQLPVGNIYLTGGGSRIAGLTETLGRGLKIGASVATPSLFSAGPVYLNEVMQSPRHVIAAGLAMNEVS